MQAAPGGGPFQQPSERGRGLRGRVGLIKIIYIRERFAVQDVGGALRRGRVLREAVREAGVELRPVCSLGYRPAKPVRPRTQTVRSVPGGITGSWGACAFKGRRFEPSASTTT